MDDSFKIYVEQLREGQEKVIEESLSSAFLDIHERDLAFTDKVVVEGKTYVADQELVLNLAIDAEALLPCSICNDTVHVPIHIDNFYYAEPLADIKTGIYNFKDVLRETILLETPLFAKCNNENCLRQQEFTKYLKPATDTKSDEDEGYQPFADLDWKP